MNIEMRSGWMTYQLYYQDPYIKEFEAMIKRTEIDEEGRSYVVLDQTAFYPNGGGQPCDLGTINGIPVTNVEKEENEIRHFLSQPLNDTYSQVKGIINWERRFDHMQQHLAQHILTAAFVERLGIETLSFHLGLEDVTIDLDVKSLDKEQLSMVEERANQIIEQNQPIRTEWIDESQLTKYPLRKKPSVHENIRLVIIDDFDYNPCGGTHPHTTGECQMVLIKGMERHRGKIRIHFVAGHRVRNQFHAQFDVLKQLGDRLSSGQDELPKRLEQVIEKNTLLEDQIKTMVSERLDDESDTLIANGEEIGVLKLIVKHFHKGDFKYIQSLTRHLQQKDEHAICLFSLKKENRLHLICGKGQSVPLNMNQLIKDTLPMIDGKGGGKPEMAQGAGYVPEDETAPLQFLREKLFEQVNKI